MFIEIGSQKEQWTDSKAGLTIANTILAVVKSELPQVKEVGIGLGGTHYCNRFNPYVLSGGYLVQICPKYALSEFDECMINQIISQSETQVNYALLDWKGMGQEKNRIIKLLETKGIEIRKA